MQRAATTLVGLAVVVVVVWLVAHNFQPPKAIGRDPGPHLAADAGDDESRVPMFALGDAGARSEDAGPLLMAELGFAERRVDGGAGLVMPDGTQVPPLPMNAPHQVRFGVVLVSYAGAQPSAGGGRPSTRSKADAKGLSDKLRVTADQDFHAAVQQGDAGSSDDVGRVRQGILEPAPEYLLFTLRAGEIAGPLDTPRGYWIVKRLE
jgi:hypothetical protein